MIQKIKSLWNRKVIGVVPEHYTRQQLESAYKLGHSDGKKAGLAIARVQAMNSLREILQQQNRQ